MEWQLRRWNVERKRVSGAGEESGGDKRKRRNRESDAYGPIGQQLGKVQLLGSVGRRHNPAPGNERATMASPALAQNGINKTGDCPVTD